MRVDNRLDREIADAYMAAPVWDESALSAYEAFRRETIQQYRYLVDDPDVGSLGVAVEVVDFDPYVDAAEMACDLRDRRLKVFASSASGNPHPFLSDTENDMFRAVHDAFGHGASGCGFDRNGEEGAWLKHCLMYSKLARRALTSETRGQLCAQSHYCEDGRFPEQKVVLLSEKFSDLTLVRMAPSPPD